MSSHIEYVEQRLSDFIARKLELCPDIEIIRGAMAPEFHGVAVRIISAVPGTTPDSPNTYNIEIVGRFHSRTEMQEAFNRLATIFPSYGTDRFISLELTPTTPAAFSTEMNGGRRSHLYSLQVTAFDS